MLLPLHMLARHLLEDFPAFDTAAAVAFVAWSLLLLLLLLLLITRLVLVVTGSWWWLVIAAGGDAQAQAAKDGQQECTGSARTASTLHKHLKNC